jgi:serine/threonine-protein kinase
MTMTTTDWAGRIIDGRYVVEAVIGRGGMGVVLAARHKFTRARVAVKMVRGDLGIDAEIEARFLAEARVPTAIDHRGVVKTLDAGKTAEGELYIVMELLAGRSLREQIGSGLGGPTTRRIGMELLDVLAAAHARGIIHRDVKPENVFLVEPDLAVKLLDFGITKLLAGTASVLPRTAAGVMLGTVAYMAPEQLIDARSVDARADLWSVSVMLYEMLSGRRPYRATTVEGMVGALMKTEPDPIRSALPSATPDIEAFFARALARDPQRRFSSAAEMAMAFAQLQISGAPPPDARPMGGDVTLATGLAATAATPDRGVPSVPASSLGSRTATGRPGAAYDPGAPVPTPFAGTPALMTGPGVPSTPAQAPPGFPALANQAFAPQAAPAMPNQPLTAQVFSPKLNPPFVPQATPATPSQPFASPAAPAVPSRPFASPAAPAIPNRPFASPATPAIPSQPFVSPGLPAEPPRPFVPQATPAIPNRPFVPQATPAIPSRPFVPPGSPPWLNQPFASQVTPIPGTLPIAPARASATTAPPRPRRRFAWVLGGVSTLALGAAIVVAATGGRSRSAPHAHEHVVEDPGAALPPAAAPAAASPAPADPPGSANPSPSAPAPAAPAPTIPAPPAPAAPAIPAPTAPAAPALPLAPSNRPGSLPTAPAPRSRPGDPQPGAHAGSPPSPRPHDATAREAEPTKPSTASTPPAAHDADVCAAGCKALASCHLGSRTCEADCARPGLLGSCLQQADNDCNRFAACWFASSCHGIAPGGQHTCAGTMECETACHGDARCICGCIGGVSPRHAAALLGYNGCALSCRDADCVARQCEPQLRSCRME